MQAGQNSIHRYQTSSTFARGRVGFLSFCDCALKTYPGNRISTGTPHAAPGNRPEDLSEHGSILPASPFRETEADGQKPCSAGGSNPGLASTKPLISHGAHRRIAGARFVSFDARLVSEADPNRPGRQILASARFETRPFWAPSLDFGGGNLWRSGYNRRVLIKAESAAGCCLRLG